MLACRAIWGDDNTFKTDFSLNLIQTFNFYVTGKEFYVQFKDQSVKSLQEEKFPSQPTRYS